MDSLHTLPTPFEVMANPISLILLGMYVGLIAWEALFPARRLPKVKYWKTKGLIAFALYFFLSNYLPFFWNGFLAEFQLLDLTFLGTFWGALAAILVYEIGLYAWHRTMHKSDSLWKIFHQMHHSAERIDSFGAFYFSPADMIGFTFLSSFMLVAVAGFTPEATILAVMTITFLSILQHGNIRTPHWLGYIIQRPEGHSLHHAKGIHAYNYCDLAFIDMIFGTFRNPKRHRGENGFYEGGSGRIKEMLLFKDISSKAKV